MKISNQINGQTKILEVTKAKLLEDYKINVSFSSGENVVVDFYPFLNTSRHPEIRKYRDKSLFSAFKISNGNLNWNNFDMIFPIEDLYLNNILHSVKLASV